MDIAILPLDTYFAKLLDDGSGRHEEIQSDKIAVPDGAETIELTCDISKMSDDAELAYKCRAEVSTDGGVTWRLVVGMSVIGTKGFSSTGGIGGKPQIVPTKSLASSALPTGKSRLLRVQLIPIKDITTQVDVVLSP